MQWLADAIAEIWAPVKIIAVVLAVGLVVESLRPAQRGQPRRHLAFNLAYIAFIVIVNSILVPPLIAIMQPIVQQHGLQIPVSFPDAIGWQIVQALSYFFIYDFFYYWFHRAQHTFSAAWVLHKLHHSEESLNITTTMRHHWLEEPIRVWLILLPMGLLFQQKPVTVGWLATAMILFGYFVHMNLRLPLGPLTPLIAGPQWHRLHHSVEPRHADRNFAAFFPIFDIVFGTYCKPERNEYPATGLHSGESLNSPLLATLSPIRDWYRMIRPGRKPTLAQIEPGAVKHEADQQGNAGSQHDVR